MIAWLNTNVVGDPVIAEAPADKYGAFPTWAHISLHRLAHTSGLGRHEHQWRQYTEPPA